MWRWLQHCHAVLRPVFVACIATWPLFNVSWIIMEWAHIWTRPLFCSNLDFQNFGLPNMMKPWSVWPIKLLIIGTLLFLYYNPHYNVLARILYYRNNNVPIINSLIGQNRPGLHPSPSIHDPSPSIHDLILSILLVLLRITSYVFIVRWVVV